MPDAKKIEDSLRKHDISEGLIKTIVAGKENFTAKSKKEEKAVHLINVINRIPFLLKIGFMNCQRVLRSLLK